jgi:hypothetical protein
MPLISIYINIYIRCVSKLDSIFKILFPFFESGLQATVISIVIRLEKYGSCLFNHALLALEKTSKSLILNLLGAYQHAKYVIFSKQ